jgi:hypothetical protein
MDTPSSLENAKWELYNARNFVLKMQKNDLNPTYLVKRNFCFETEGVVNKRMIGNLFRKWNHQWSTKLTWR